MVGHCPGCQDYIHDYLIYSLTFKHIHLLGRTLQVVSKWLAFRAKAYPVKKYCVYLCVCVHTCPAVSPAYWGRLSFLSHCWRPWGTWFPSRHLPEARTCVTDQSAGCKAPNRHELTTDIQTVCVCVCLFIRTSTLLIPSAALVISQYVWRWTPYLILIMISIILSLSFSVYRYRGER